MEDTFLRNMGQMTDLLIPDLDFGQSYAAKTLDTATEFYHSEISCVNTAASRAKSMGLTGNWILSVGATPTAHAAGMTEHVKEDELEGALELYVANLLPTLSLPVSFD
jgi:predicted RNase H-like HicB family nuclease